MLPKSASVPGTFGATLPDENIGKVDNTGFEAVLRYNAKINKVNLFVEGNMTFAKSNVVYMDEPTNVSDRIKKTGHPFDQFYGLKALGLFQNQDEINI